MEKRSKKNILFWVLQIIGWGAFGLNSWLKMILPGLDKYGSNLYFLVEGFMMVIPGVVISTFYRNHLKSINFIDNQNLKTYKKLLLPFIMCVILISLISYFGSELAYNIIDSNDKNFTLMQGISILVNMLFLMILWTGFYTAINVTLKNQKDKVERLKLEKELKEAQLNTLKGQINPHFMFNSLNNIRGLMLEDVEKSREMLTCLSEMLRASLNMNNVNAISVSEEIETVDNYIALSKIQLEDRLRYTKEIDQSLLDFEIPPMILQMLVENSIKHGISDIKDGGELHLKIFSEMGFIVLQVSNTGQLKSGTDTTKIGLENVKKRLELLYNQHAYFTLEEHNKYVYATIKIPQG